jgi:hypothetical protein
MEFLPLVIAAWPPTVRLPLRCSRIAHLVLLVFVLTPVGSLLSPQACLISSLLFRLSPVLGGYPPC